MITGAIFDIDGTLLDSMRIWKELGKRYLSTLGIEAEAELADVLYPMSLEESSRYLHTRYSLSQSPDEIMKAVLQIIKDYYCLEVSLKPGIRAFLHALYTQGIPLTLATAGDKELSLSALKRLKIEKYFKGIFTCAELNTTKKEPYIYLKAAEHIGSNPHQTLVFEDAYHALCAAKQAGFVTVAVEDRSNKKHKKKLIEIADYYLKSLEEYEFLIDKITKANF